MITENNLSHSLTGSSIKEKVSKALKARFLERCYASLTTLAFLVSIFLFTCSATAQTPPEEPTLGDITVLPSPNDNGWDAFGFFYQAAMRHQYNWLDTYYTLSSPAPPPLPNIPVCDILRSVPLPPGCVPFEILNSAAVYPNPTRPGWCFNCDESLPYGTANISDPSLRWNLMNMLNRFTRCLANPGLNPVDCGSLYVNEFEQTCNAVPDGPDLWSCNIAYIDALLDTGDASLFYQSNPGIFSEIQVTFTLPLRWWLEVSYSLNLYSPPTLVTGLVAVRNVGKCRSWATQYYGNNCELYNP